MINTAYKGKKMLVVVAHPDDETFGMGGTLALYSHLGVEIHLICATRGEVGEVDPKEMKGYRSVGELREHELRCAADILKLKKIHFLDYRDSGMPGSVENKHPNAFINAQIEQVAKQIAVLMREIMPDVVLTFDSIGGYMHPDHIAAHQATVAAFDLSGKETFKTRKFKPFLPSKLYFHTFPRRSLKLIVQLMPLFGKDPKQFGKNKDIDLAAITSKDFPIEAKIKYKKFAHLREQASSCHASQGGDRSSGYFVTWIMRKFNSVETYMRGYPEFRGKKIERDLFEGLLID
jgi:N-acetyl-1-D-myo-inositol-2-amino-2-deoxy-alpha-D-glucopyranoside deacetylase